MIRKNKIRNGNRQGYWELYYPPFGLDGKEIWNRIFSCGYYENGLKHGLWKEFLPCGTLKIEQNFVNGKINGINRHYHDNGNLSATGNGKNNIRTDEWSFYDKENVLQRKILYIL